MKPLRSITRAASNATATSLTLAFLVSCSAHDSSSSASAAAANVAGSSGPARVVLPTRASEAFSVTDAASGIGVAVRLQGTTDAPAKADQGDLRYDGALANVPGAHLVLRSRAQGVEDYMHFASKPAHESLHYDVALSRQVAGVRFVENVLELLDARGAPRLRMAAPYFVDAAGVRANARVAVTGCATDRSAAPPWGRKVTPPGARSCQVTVSWSSNAYPLVVDPSWTTTESMSSAHLWGPRALLPSGQVLVAGGYGTDTEIYDRASQTWAVAGSMRSDHYGTIGGVLLPTGKVLATGGTTTETELFDAALGTWSAGAPMAVEHRFFSMSNTTLLPDGRVIVAGGIPDERTTEIYTPDAGAGSWATVAPLAQYRGGHIVLVMKDGRVFTIGGALSDPDFAEIFDPVTATWTTSGASLSLRHSPSGAVLPDGKILIAGGRNSFTLDDLTDCHIYDPATDTFTATGAMATPRSYFPFATLPDGTLLALGGLQNNPVATETFDLTTHLWSSAGNAAAAHTGVHATTLQTGEVLVAGGWNQNAVAEVFGSRAANGTACTTDAQCFSGHCTDLACSATAAPSIDAGADASMDAAADAPADAAEDSPADAAVDSGATPDADADADADASADADADADVADSTVVDAAPPGAIDAGASPPTVTVEAGAPPAATTTATAPVPAPFDLGSPGTPADDGGGCRAAGSSPTGSTGGGILMILVLGVMLRSKRGARA